MSNINLFKYIDNWLLLKNLAENDLYDGIVFESFDNDQLERPENIPVHKLNQTNTHQLAWACQAYHEQYDRLLLILKDSSIHYLWKFLAHSDETKKVTIINLWTWISGQLIKWEAETHDISLLVEHNRSVAEPFDFVSFFKMLEHDSLQYIRIPHKERSSNLLQSEWAVLSESGLLDLTSFELSGDDGTILCPWGHINECIQAVEMSKEKSYDLFVLYNYSFTLTDSFKASLEKTEKLMLLLDQDNVSTYVDIVKSKLYEHWMNNIDIVVITPDTKLTTNQAEHIYEQAGFGIEWIVEHLK